MRFHELLVNKLKTPDGAPQADKSDDSYRDGAPRAENKDDSYRGGAPQAEKTTTITGTERPSPKNDHSYITRGWAMPER